MSSSSTNKRRPTSAWARAPGKVILAGEQFVVLGAPAVSMAINLYSHVEVTPSTRNDIEIGIDIPLRFLAKSRKVSEVEDSGDFLQPLKIAAEAALGHSDGNRRGIDVNVECDIPVAAGLGSSASTTVAIISAVSKFQGVTLGKKEIFKLAFIPERFLHGKPSGVDQATCIYGGTLEFTRPHSVKPVRIEKDPVLLLCDTGVHHQTKKLVGSVVEKSKVQKSDFRDYLDQVRGISKGVVKALNTGDSDELGVLMSQNHELLQKIGVSHPKLDHLVTVAKRAGALGAKLTGAGGGGCIIAACSSSRARKRIASRLQREGGTPYTISQDTRGVESGIR